jgi:transposase
MAYKMRNRMQQTYLPASIDEYVTPQDPVRVYDAFVDALDFNALGISLDPKPGADEYYPKDMLKLVLYAYSYGCRSSRKIDRACHHNLSFKWLMGGLTPDYRSIARFRSKYKEQIKRLLKECVHICLDLDLVEGNCLFTDGSKFRANAAIHNNWTKEKASKALKTIHERIDRLVEESEKLDEDDDHASMVELHKKIEDRERLVRTIQTSLQQLHDSQRKNINSTDPDSVKAKGRQGTHASYNVQISVDNKHGFIVGSEAVQQNNDLNQLHEQLLQAGENLGKMPAVVCADAGYNSIEDLAKIPGNIQIVVPNQRQLRAERAGSSSNPFDKEQFKYDSVTDTYICPEGHVLTFTKYRSGRHHREYMAAAGDCQDCRYFGICTRAIRGRTVTRLTHEDVRKRVEDTYASSAGQEVYRLRKEKVEHPFGHFKRNLGAGQFMLRGKPGVDAEASILSTCFNIARMITIIGIPQLIMRLNSG